VLSESGAWRDFPRILGRRHHPSRSTGPSSQVKSPEQSRACDHNLVVNAHTPCPKRKAHSRKQDVMLDRGIRKQHPRDTGPYVCRHIHTGKHGQGHATRIFDPSSPPRARQGYGLRSSNGVRHRQTERGALLYSSPQGTTFKVFLPRAMNPLPDSSERFSAHAARSEAILLSRTTTNQIVTSVFCRPRRYQ